MKKMKKILVIILSLFAFFNLNAQNNNLPDTLFLRNKPYYKTIFDKNEISELNNAFKIRTKSNKYLTKYNNLIASADEYDQLAKKSTQKSKKYTKKSIKLKAKANKIGNKGFDLMLESNKIIKTNYKRKLSFYADENKHKQLIYDLNNEISSYRDSIKNVDSFMLANKIAGNTIFRKSYIIFFENKIFLVDEYKFAIYQNDGAIITALTKKTGHQPEKKPEPENKATDTVIPVNPYNPDKDPFLYHTNNKKLDGKISFNQPELNAIQEYYKKGKEAYQSLKSIPLLNDSIEFYEIKIRNENNIDTLKKLVKKKNIILQKIKKDSLNAISKYYLANEKYYKARIDHIKDFKSKDSIKQKRADSVFALSDQYLKSSQYCLKHPDSLPYDTIYAYKIANQQLITSLEYQENAFNFLVFGDTINVVPKYKLILAPIDTTKVDTKVKKDTTKIKKDTTKVKTKPKVKHVAKINGLYFYSYNHPKPVKTTTPKGTIYRVQVGVSKYKLPVNELKEYDKIYFETIKGSKYKRFLVGDWTDLATAKENLKKLKAKGYKAKIVKYIDAKRQGAVYSNTYTAPKPTKNAKYNAIDISSTKYLNYFVQIGTFSAPKTAKDLGNPGKLYYKLLSDGRVQYFVGPYYRYAQIKNKLKSIKEKGFNDAIIVAYNNGKPTTIADARKIEANVQTNRQTTNQVIYRVQIGAFSDYLTDAQYKQKFSKALDIYPIIKYKENNLIIYAAGKAKTIDKAREIKQVLVNMGFTDAFIISFKGGVKVPLSTVNK